MPLPRTNASMHNYPTGVSPYVPSLGISFDRYALCFQVAFDSGGFLSAEVVADEDKGTMKGSVVVQDDRLQEDAGATQISPVVDGPERVPDPVHSSAAVLKNTEANGARTIGRLRPPAIVVENLQPVAVELIKSFVE